LQESLTNAARLYQNIPIERINVIDQPLVALSDAIKSKAGRRFTSAFADLTNACNGCHVVAQVGYISIQIPTASPFANQSFVPKDK
jgi:hypothetical protein